MVAILTEIKKKRQEKEQTFPIIAKRDFLRRIFKFRGLYYDAWII